MSFIKKEKRSLGLSLGRQPYDLPLNKDNANLFLMILMSLMAFLVIASLAAAFVLSAMGDRWSDGLEGKASVEIPATDQNDLGLSQGDIDTLTDRANILLNDHPAIETAQIMDKQDVIALVSPWLGDNLGIENIPIPGLISVEFKKDIVFDVKDLENALKSISPTIRLDTHESWLKDVLSFTNGLKLAALTLTIIIFITTIVTVAGSIYFRMAVYREELELLHLMGASDNYISHQLQRYAFITILKGAGIGMVAGWLFLLFTGWLASRMDINLLPDFTLSWLQIIMITLIPIIIALLGAITARQTVLRFLYKMP